MLKEINDNKLTTNFIRIKRITLNAFTIMHTDNCFITLKNERDCITCTKDNFLFLEKNMTFSCEIVKVNEKLPPFSIVSFDRKSQILLKDILKEIYPLFMGGCDIQREKIITENSISPQYQLFELITRTNDLKLKVIKSAYLIATMKNHAKIISSLYASCGITFTDKVKNELRKDLSKNWKISMIADKFNISEVSVRKRLSSEKTSFSQLLLQARMDRALQLILDNELPLSSVSESIGISSMPYFIRVFKYFFGITPKQFSIYFRE